LRGAVRSAAPLVSLTWDALQRGALVSHVRGYVREDRPLQVGPVLSYVAALVAVEQDVGQHVEFLVGEPERAILDGESLFDQFGHGFFYVADPVTVCT
jgi:hypothetical protein